ncbi:MAG: hypothetical protein IPK14_03305 [Blastocatellia bacterium]|nr:hypothetical protein [Blastocatellia bacterium]
MPSAVLASLKSKAVCELIKILPLASTAIPPLISNPSSLAPTNLVCNSL